MYIYAFSIYQHLAGRTKQCRKHIYGQLSHDIYLMLCIIDNKCLLYIKTEALFIHIVTIIIIMVLIYIISSRVCVKGEGWLILPLSGLITQGIGHLLNNDILKTSKYCILDTLFFTSIGLRTHQWKGCLQPVWSGNNCTWALRLKVNLVFMSMLSSTNFLKCR